MSPKPDISEERKNQILEAAAKVFSERGIHQSRMDDVAAASGVSKGLLYWYFKSKEEIIVAITERLFAREMGLMNDLATQEGPALQQLHDIVSLMIYDLEKIRPLLPLVYEFFAMMIRQKTAHIVARNMFGQFSSGLEKVIQRGIDQGLFRQVDAHDAVIAIGAVIEGTYLLWAYDPELVDIEKHIRSGVELIINGLVV